MKEIQKLSISQLQNEEAFGFFTLVKEEMDNLPADPGEGVAPLKAVKEAYIEKLDAYDEALETSNKLDSVQTVEAVGRVLRVFEGDGTPSGFDDTQCRIIVCGGV